jgi:hypothetical protein
MYFLFVLIALRIIFIYLASTVQKSLFPYLLYLAINILLFLRNIT